MMMGGGWMGFVGPAGAEMLIGERGWTGLGEDRLRAPVGGVCGSVGGVDGWVDSDG